MNILPPGRLHDWQTDWARRADEAPLCPRLPLYAGAERIGSVAPALLERLQDAGQRLDALGLHRHEDPHAARCRLDGEPTQALAQLASALGAAGLVQRWHDERVSVPAADGRCIAAVERGVTRLLGLPVLCVHLVGVVEGVGTWVQQRAMSKSEAPGLWDTLMGGTVGFGETVEVGLWRELWEEAGLRPDDLRSLQARGRVRVARPTRPDDELSYSVDLIDCRLASMAPGATPVNQDGEVIRFELLSPDGLAERLLQDRFTLEAAGVLLRVSA